MQPSTELGAHLGGIAGSSLGNVCGEVAATGHLAMAGGLVVVFLTAVGMLRSALKAGEVTEQTVTFAIRKSRNLLPNSA